MRTRAATPRRSRGEHLLENENSLLHRSRDVRHNRAGSYARQRTNSALWGPDGVVGAITNLPKTGESVAMRAGTRIPGAALGVAMAGLAAASRRSRRRRLGSDSGRRLGANVPNGKFADGAQTGLVVNGFAGYGTGKFGVRGELFWSRSDLDNAFIRKVGNYGPAIGCARGRIRKRGSRWRDGEPRHAVVAIDRSSHT